MTKFSTILDTFDKEENLHIYIVDKEDYDPNENPEHYTTVSFMEIIVDCGNIITNIKEHLPTFLDYDVIHIGAGSNGELRIALIKL